MLSLQGAAEADGRYLGMKNCPLNVRHGSTLVGRSGDKKAIQATVLNGGFSRERHCGRSHAATIYAKDWMESGAR